YSIRARPRNMSKPWPRSCLESIVRSRWIGSRCDAMLAEAPSAWGTLLAMAKARTHFICRSCGGVQTQWMGKCPDCGTWDGLEKFVEPKPLKDPSHAGLAESWSVGDGGTAAAIASRAVATPLPNV